MKTSLAVLISLGLFSESSATLAQKKIGSLSQTSIAVTHEPDVNTCYTTLPCPSAANSQAMNDACTKYYPAPLGVPVDAYNIDANGVCTIVFPAEPEPGDSFCSNNCDSGNCHTCLCPNNTSGWMTDADIKKACALYSGWNQDSCYCIVKHESGGNLYSQLRDSDGANDVGVWGMNSSQWPKCNNGNPPCELASNLACAIMEFEETHDWRGWSTCIFCNNCNTL